MDATQFSLVTQKFQIGSAVRNRKNLEEAVGVQLEVGYSAQLSIPSLRQERSLMREGNAADALFCRWSGEWIE
jgi:hypothetical protein